MKHYLVLAALAAFVMLVSFSRGLGRQSPGCGQVLAGYKGVAAFSNDRDQGTGQSCGSPGIYGLQYQCVEYVKRFYSMALGFDTHLWRGNADTYFITATTKGLIAFQNGGPVKPEADDILVFGGATYGHVAIITSVTATHVDVIEQNWSRSGTAPLELRSSNGNYTLTGRGRYVVCGWLRRPIAPPVTLLDQRSHDREFPGGPGFIIGQTFAFQSPAVVSSVDTLLREGFARCGQDVQMSIWRLNSSSGDLTQGANLVATSSNAVDPNTFDFGQFTFSFSEPVPIQASTYYFWGVYAPLQDCDGPSVAGASVNQVAGDAWRLYGNIQDPGTFRTLSNLSLYQKLPDVNPALAIADFYQVISGQFQ